VVIDRNASLRFLQTAYQADDWVAVLLKWHDTGRTVQRVAPIAVVTAPRVQDWFIRENRAAASVYVSVNTIMPGKTSRRRRDVRAIRHLFLDADHDGTSVVAAIDARQELPPPSYVLHTSPGRVHVFWRAGGFTREQAEAVQRQLARELHTDPAAVACSQTTRLPGFRNWKYDSEGLVTVEYRDVARVYTPDDFPEPAGGQSGERLPVRTSSRSAGPAVLERARRYVAALPPAVAGQHGDPWTFRVCCRLVRGFALSDSDAMSVLAGWNPRCLPPWSERELRDKLRHARRYGREPIGRYADSIASAASARPADNGEGISDG
jgi:hypothetical protein